MPTEMLENVTTGSGCRVIFRVGLGTGSCLLRFESDRETVADRAVVIVDARRFSRRWLSHYTRMDQREWASQPEFAQAGRRLLSGHTNPLGIPAARPLATLSPLLRLLGLFASLLGVRQLGRSISLQRGSNRVAWLLVNGAVSFPLECNARDAAAVHAMVGVSDQPVITMSAMPAPALAPKASMEMAPVPTASTTPGLRRPTAVVGLHRVK